MVLDALKRSLTFCFFEIASPPARNDPGDLACDDPGELGRDDEEGEDFFPFSDILFSFFASRKLMQRIFADANR